MRAALLVAAVTLCSWPAPGTAAWFEVVGARSAAAARLQTEGAPGNVTLCDGAAANATVAVEGGSPPWKVTLLRDGETYSRVLVDQPYWQQQLQLSSVPSGTAKLRLPLPGRYSLARVCDQGGCNGTVSEKDVVVSLARHPTARILPQHQPVCMEDSPGGFASLNQSNWKIEVLGTPPFLTQFVRVGHQHEKRNLLNWDDAADGLSVQYMSAGLHDLPAELFGKKGLWALSLISDESGCAADMSAITWTATLAVVPRPRVAMELISRETCGGQDALILVRLLEGNPPWTFRLKTPDGSIKEITGLSDRTYVYQAMQAGNYSVVGARDGACDALAGGLPTSEVLVSTRARVSGRLEPAHIGTCPGVLQEIRGHVKGIGPWWLEIHRNGEYWRRILHHAAPDREAGAPASPLKAPQAGTDAVPEEWGFSFEVESPGEYTLYSVTDSTQCSAHGTGTVTVTDKPAPQVRMRQEQACEGDELMLNVNASGACVVTVMASGWAAPRDIKVVPGSSRVADHSRKHADTPAAARMVNHAVALFKAGETSPGQYTVLRVRDEHCEAVASQSMTVHPRPQILLRGSTTHVCDNEASGDWASLEVRSNSGFVGEWSAIIRHPSGHEETVAGIGAEAKFVRVSQPGTYALVKAFSLNPRCEGPLPQQAEVTANGATGTQNGRTVTVTRFETPRVVMSGGGTVCRAGGTGAMVDLVAQVSGGIGPYRILFARDGVRDREFRQVVSPDGRLVVPVRQKGAYNVVEVQDTHKCARKEPSNRVEVTLFPTALAAFEQQFIGLCPGDKPQPVRVGVSGKEAPAPWQLAVLRNGRYHQHGQVVNTSRSEGSFEFMTEEVVDGLRTSDGTVVDEYQIDRDSFTDARGCLGDIKRGGTLKVKMNVLPSVQVLAKSRRGTCENDDAVLKFTGVAPWAVTIQLWGDDRLPHGAKAETEKAGKGKDSSVSSTCEISGITQREFSLSALKGISGSERGSGASLLRTTCPRGVGGRSGGLAAGYHVITQVRGGHDDVTTGGRMCRREGIAVPVVIHQLPRAEVRLHSMSLNIWMHPRSVSSPMCWSSAC